MIDQEARHSQQEFVEAVGNIERIVISFTDAAGMPSTRSCRPFMNFGELLARVKTLFDGYHVTLIVASTNAVVGSQDELLFAYRDVEDDQTTMHLTANLVARKRKIQEVETDDESEGGMNAELNSAAEHAPQVVNTSRVWTPVERELFGKGVAQYGWGKWMAISTIVSTRTPHQCRSFSRTKAGLSFKTVSSVPTVVLSQLASVVNTLSQSFALEQKQQQQEVAHDGRDG